jgi:2-desacetyl-2-hydroxyethyl bacteriochlorophyllide A dehydrogenase
MKVLVCTEPRKLAYGIVDAPKAKPGYAIIRIRRIGVCGTDLHAFEGTQPYFNYPRILGHELSGELIDTDGANGFRLGDIVTFLPYYSCGECIACRTGKTNCCVNMQVCGVHVDGGMAEYLQIPSDNLVNGEGLSIDELALIEPLAIGAHAIHRANVQQGEFVLVIGAGPIGLGIMEFARIAGGKVIAVDVNEQRLEFCRKQLKADYTINPLKENVNLKLAEITDGDMLPVVIDATGNQKAIVDSFKYMAHGGRYILVGLQKGDIVFSHPEFHKREGTMMSSRNATRADFEQVINFIKQGLVDPKTYITNKVSFDDVKENFESWLDPGNGVIKAMICID